ncbi:radical SAM protein [Endozoicomonas ascidiicola]|uniref:radical SAM protein n=1 Tax=Endozoicomonas ascidiicola TaxID=1698521 RepID=UPI000B30A35C|nr:radical SAM protein [Endozoicomonas ascidiicola]
MTIELRYLKDGCKIKDSDQCISARINSEGYWCSFRVRNRFYRRCMDGSVVKGAEALTMSAALVKKVHEEFELWVQGVACNDLTIKASQGLTTLDYENQARLYRVVYPEEVSILPPDRYSDIVLMPAIGCPNRRCTFCAFYKDKPYKILSEQAFTDHLTAVKQLYRGKVSSSPGVFLGSANAMALSQRRLMFCLEVIKEKLGTFKREIGSFIDPDFSAKRSAEDWSELREAGLRHIVVGLETGWSELRASLGKAGDLTKCVSTINTARGSGVSIGLTILAGAAPRQQRMENLKQTMMTIENLELTSEDLIYLSPLSRDGVVVKGAIDEQKEMKEVFSAVTEARIIPYQMNRFQYFM